MKRTTYILLFWIVIIFVFAVVPGIVYAQRTYNFTQITTAEGLSSNTINTIIEDRHGYVWFGTSNGLNRFDGTNIIVYRNDTRDSLSLPGNEIHALYEDKQGKLWVGTSNGLCYYDPLKDSFINIKSLKGVAVRSICQDYKNNFWVGSYSDLRIFDLKTSKVTRVTMPYKARQSENVWAILCLFEDKLRRMWVGSQVGLYQYDQDYHLVKSFVRNDNSIGLSSNTITDIKEDHKGRLWFSTINGLNLLRPDGSFQVFRESKTSERAKADVIHSIVQTKNKLELWLGTDDGLRIFDLTTSQTIAVKPNWRNIFGLKNNEVKSIFVDSNNIIWIGLGHGGVNKFDHRLALFDFQRSSMFSPRILPSPIVTSFAPSKNGNFYIGTIGAGLQMFNKQSRSIIPVSFNGLFKKLPIVLSLKMTKKNVLWIGTNEDGIFKFDVQKGIGSQILAPVKGKSTNENTINCIEEDRYGKIWVGTNGRGLKIFDPVNNQWLLDYQRVESDTNPAMPINGFIKAISEKQNGDIWIASYGSGIAVFHPATHQFTHYNRSHGNLPNEHILSILHDRNQHTWVGSNAGLSVFDEKTQNFRTLTENDGLPSRSVVYKILEDKKGNIWLSTNNGISCFNPATNKIINYTPDNGVARGPFYEGAGVVSQTGEIFFGSESGFNFFDPAYLPNDSSSPEVILTKLKVSNNEVTPGKSSAIQSQINFADEINLKFGENFTIEYTTLNFTNPHQNQFSYQLEGFEKTWNYVGNNKSASFTNLDPGHYEFKVRASNDNQNWSAKIKSIRINVTPPWWRTIYAYFFYAIAILSVLYIHRSNSIQKIKMKFELEQERSRAKESVERERLEAERLRTMDHLKIKFLTNLSHDFRTPLSLILGPVDKLVQFPDPLVANESNMIQRNAKRLLNLVNQLLDFRKMEEQQLKLQASAGDLVQAIKDAAESFQDIADKKKITFIFSSEVGDLPAIFDHDKIERVVFNLLSNAFKFTMPGGNVLVHLYSTNKSETQNFLCLEVTDTGIGIPPDQQKKIFEPFFQYDFKSATTNQGSGIGLSIVKEFVKMHGGWVNVESEVGKGSTFKVELPVNPIDLDETLLPPSNASIDGTELSDNIELLSSTSGATVRILLVDDDEDFRFYLKDNLKAYYEIFEASDGRDGWKKTLSLHPQLIVSDISMPFINGIDLSKKIKADKRTCHIPVILLTALQGERKQVEALESGANDYLTKPLNFEILNVKIKNLLHLNETLKNSYLKKVQIVQQDNNVESIDVKLLKKINLYIEQNISNTSLTVEEISAHVGMSRGTLYRKLLELTELSPIEYIRSIKLEKAANLLEKSDLNVSQIAYMTGFANPNYFAKIFRTKYKMSPKEYISQAKHKN